MCDYSCGRRRQAYEKATSRKHFRSYSGKPMLEWVISSLKKAGINDICIVKGFKKECIDEFVSTLDFKVETVYQAERLGTGHAVMMAKDFLESHQRRQRGDFKRRRTFYGQQNY